MKIKRYSKSRPVREYRPNPKQAEWDKKGVSGPKKK